MHTGRMKTMRYLLGAEWLRGVLFALIALGLLLSLFAACRYISAERELQGNLAQVIRSGQLNVSPQTGNEAQGLVGADIARRAPFAQQLNVLMPGGDGLALLSLVRPGLNRDNFLRCRESLVSSTEETV